MSILESPNLSKASKQTRNTNRTMIRSEIMRRNIQKNSEAERMLNDASRMHGNTSVAP